MDESNVETQLAIKTLEAEFLSLSLSLSPVGAIDF